MDRFATVQSNLKDQLNAVVFISSPTCSICHVDEPKVRQLATDYHIPFYHLDSVEDPELAGFFEVLTVPAVLVYHEGKEIARQARFIDFKNLEKRFAELPMDTLPTDYESLFK
ncbi:MAG: thioredoxin family protein [Enterococcus sp.]|uniref:thioredoxin family protein n=1 Tax=Enterococcus sp. TaxID=35783 RepID=UPI002FC8CEA4